MFEILQSRAGSLSHPEALPGFGARPFERAPKPRLLLVAHSKLGFGRSDSAYRLATLPLVVPTRSSGGARLDRWKRGGCETDVERPSRQEEGSCPKINLCF